MDIYDLNNKQIEKLSPEEFRNLIIGNEDEDEEEDDDYGDDSGIEEVDGELIDYLDKRVILLGNSEIDGGLDLPSLRQTYNIRVVKSFRSTGSYYSSFYEKIDPNKAAYAFYKSDGWKELIKV